MSILRKGGTESGETSKPGGEPQIQHIAITFTMTLGASPGEGIMGGFVHARYEVGTEGWRPVYRGQSKTQTSTDTAATLS